MKMNMMECERGEEIILSFFCYQELFQWNMYEAYRNGMICLCKKK